MTINRRQFLLQTAGALGAAPVLGRFPRRRAADLPPVRALTRGPAYHWFGYYDKLETDPTDRFVLGMAVDFEHRSPTARDVIRVGMVDTENDDAWIDLGTSRAWNWQQGCMLQWRPGSATDVLWNDRQGGRFVCHLLNIETGRQWTLPHPVYTISPDGGTALSVDFERIQDMRPGYGYPGIADPHRDALRPDEAGIYLVDLETGARRLIVSIADAAGVPFPHRDLSEAKHYFNHLLFNPDGARFVFLHRWRFPDTEKYRDVGGFGTRMFTAAADGSDLRVIDDSGYTSHFIWRDPEHILAWTRLEEGGDGFYLFRDADEPEPEPVGRGVMTRNGHCTYLPGGQYILNDTYPDGDRLQHVYLYEIETGELVTLGEFRAPEAYRGEWRVDTHPRSTRDGRGVIIDSAHGGDGRQLYHIDISGIVG